jgi:AraC-like DNA-binding protein
MENNFIISKHTWANSSTQKAMLHSHHEYELYMFLKGDCYYVVEGRRYELTPGDMIIIRKHEMHRIFHNSFGEYSSFVFFFKPEFFSENNCLEYEEAFLDYSKDNKIDSHVVLSSGIQDIIDRIIKYSNNFQIHDSPVIRGVLVELLHNLNGITAFEKPEKTNQTVKKIITYLNDNYTNDIDLDQVAEKFFISKYHLCRVFKKATGLTLQEYIRRKRLTLALELKRQGVSLSEAANQSGFHDYTSFYRYYKKRYKKAPKTAKE